MQNWGYVYLVVLDFIDNSSVNPICRCQTIFGREKTRKWKTPSSGYFFHKQHGTGNMRTETWAAAPGSTCRFHRPDSNPITNVWTLPKPTRNASQGTNHENPKRTTPANHSRSFLALQIANKLIYLLETYKPQKSTPHSNTSTWAKIPARGLPFLGPHCFWSALAAALLAMASAERQRRYFSWLTHPLRSSRRPCCCCCDRFFTQKFWRPRAGSAVSAAVVVVLVLVRHHHRVSNHPRCLSGVHLLSSLRAFCGRWSWASVTISRVICWVCSDKLQFLLQQVSFSLSSISDDQRWFVIAIVFRPFFTLRKFWVSSSSKNLDNQGLIRMWDATSRLQNVIEFFFPEKNFHIFSVWNQRVERPPRPWQQMPA